MSRWLRSVIVAGSVLVGALASASELWSQEEVAEPLAPTLSAISFDSTQTSEVFFRLCDQENVREIRTETVREIIREAPLSIHH